MVADELLANVKARGGYPASAVVSLTDNDIMNAATEEMWSYLVPWIESTNEDFNTDFDDYAVVASQAAYTMPTRAVGGALRALKYVDSAGNEGTPLARIELGNTAAYSGTSSNLPFGFWFTSSAFNIIPTPSVGVTGSLRAYYGRRPGKLVLDTRSGGQSTQVGIIASVTSTTVTLTGAHNGWPLVGGKVDIIAAAPPFKMLARDVTVTAAAAGTATLTVSGVDLTTLGISAGDYVTVQRTSYVPQLPLEWHSLLELRTVARAFAVIGDLEGQREALQMAEEMRKNLMGLSQPRSAVNTRKINAWA